MSLMRIDDLFHFEKGSLQSSKCTEGEFDFITASSEWKTHNEYTHDCEALVFAAAASGSLGRTHYVNGKFIASDLCFIITPKNQNELPIDLKFYHMIFNEFKDDIVKNTKAGTSKEAIGLKAFGNYKLPYFNIDKQVEAKNQFVNMQEYKVELNSALTIQLDLIKQLRQAFLREAMQGKLLTAVTSSGVEKQESGHDLLAKIKAEKAQLIAEKKLKKEKELPSITKDEIPFEIPEHWAWCRLGEIINISSGDGLTASQMDKNGTIPVYGGNGINGYHNKYTIDKETIVIGRVGYYCGCVHLTSKYAWVTDNAFIVKYSEKNINRDFLIQLLKWADLGKQQFAGSQPVISGQRVYPKLIPLPPLHEQEQIVAKLEELMAFCDSLEQSITESQGYNEKLLQQVLREALQG